MKKTLLVLTILNSLFISQLNVLATCPFNCEQDNTQQFQSTTPNCNSCCEQNNNCAKFFSNKCTFDTQREKIYSQLCLSETQACQIQKLDDEYALRFKCYQEKIAFKKQKICELEKCSPVSCEVKELKNDIKQLKKSFKCERKEYEKRFLCLLSKSQQRDYKRIKNEMHKCNKALEKARKKCQQCN